jgi:Icc-related predicted phosphoesterase
MMRLGIVILAFFILFSFSNLSFLSTKNSSKKIISNIHCKGWWEEKTPNQQLTFSPSEQLKLQWEDDHEFVFKGEFYDVIEQSDSCGYSIFKVYKDHHDTQWKALKTLAKKQKKEQKSNHSFSLIWICDFSNPFPFLIPFEEKEGTIHNKINPLLFISTNTHSPPPEA